MTTNDDRDRYATIGSAFLHRVAERLRNLNPDELSPSDLARWTDLALKLERAGYREPPQHTPRTQDQQDDDQGQP